MGRRAYLEIDPRRRLDGRLDCLLQLSNLLYQGMVSRFITIRVGFGKLLDALNAFARCHGRG